MNISWPVNEKNGSSFRFGEVLCTILEGKIELWAEIYLAAFLSVSEPHSRIEEQKPPEAKEGSLPRELRPCVNSSEVSRHGAATVSAAW